MDTASATTAMDTDTVMDTDTMESAKDPPKPNPKPTHLPKPLPNPDTDTTHTDMVTPSLITLTAMVIPLMLDTDTIILARGLLSPLLLPDTDTDTDTAILTDTDTLMA